MATMQRTASADDGSDGGHGRWRMAAACLLAAVAVASPGRARGAAPLVAQAGQALVAPGLDQAAKPANPVANVPGAKMAQNFANAPAAGAAAAAAPAPPAASTAGGLGSLQTFAVSYALMALLIGLGTFIICRPRSLTLPAEKGK